MHVDIPNLREFVKLTSSSDPRRVWKGGSELHFMTPLRRDQQDLWDPQANSKKLCFSWSFVNLTHLSVFDINYFTRILTPHVYNHRF